jgi:uncharacterized membrane protein
VREKPETRLEKWRRWWHLHGTGWLKNWALPWALALILVGVILSLSSALRGAVSWVGSGIEESRLWMSLSPSSRSLLTGCALVAVGLSFISRTFLSRRKRTPDGSGVLRLRVFVGGCALSIAGGICVLRAFGLL